MRDRSHKPDKKLRVGTLPFMKQSSSSTVAKRPRAWRDASCHWIFRRVTQVHWKSFEV